MEGAFLSLFYWEKFEKVCCHLILYFSFELQRKITRNTKFTMFFLGESQRVTLHLKKKFKCNVTRITRYNSPKSLQTGCYALCYALTFLFVTRFCLAFALA